MLRNPVFKTNEGVHWSSPGGEVLYACHHLSIHAYIGKCTRIYKVYLHFHIFNCVTLCMYHRISFDCVVYTCVAPGRRHIIRTCRESA